MRDAVVDKKAGIRHTADLIGLRWTKVLMLVSITGAILVLVAFMVMQVIPLWLLAVPIVVGPMLFADKLSDLIRGRVDVIEDRESMHQPALLLGVITFLVWFVADKLGPLG